MTATWLVLDVNYLASRMFYTTPLQGLSHKGIPTGVLFGFLRGVLDLQNRWCTNNLVFCFDYGRGLREQRFPNYKLARRLAKTQTNTRLLDYKILDRQLDLLRTELLSELGYVNVFYQEGYEADDVIAGTCLSTAEDDPESAVVIVSADKDLYQCLDRRVTMYVPNKTETYPSGGSAYGVIQYCDDYYGLSPGEWPLVKAISGCRSDGIAGLDGIGDKTAAKYLAGLMNPALPNYRRIEQFVSTTEEFMNNMHMATLPFAGLQTFKVQRNNPNRSTWGAVLKRLGMASLARRV